MVQCSTTKTTNILSHENHPLYGTCYPPTAILLIRLKADPSLRLGDVTSLNVTMLGGGIQWNVVPDAMSLGLDVRVTLSDSHQVSYNPFILVKYISKNRNAI